MQFEQPAQPSALGESWRTAIDTNIAGPAPGIRSWLTHSGLLTRRLQQACGNAFRLHLLRFDRTELTRADAQLLKGAENGMVRDIRLCCQDLPRVFARTVIPNETLNRHPWLSDLGESPLGETLHEHAFVERSEFEYACIRQGHALFERAIENTGIKPKELWARRSLFYLGQHELLVYEIFLPGVAECELS